jgi:hydroxyacyl-ACP dehydratase HTD2-like protein with hotdog domain
VRYDASLVHPPNFKFHHVFFQDETILANVTPFSYETLNLFSPSNPPFEVKMWIFMKKEKEK